MNDWLYATEDLMGAREAERNAITIAPGSRIRVALRWNERWGSASSAYDLALFPVGSDTPVATARQAGRGLPVDRLSFRSPNGGDYEIAIRHQIGRAHV